MSLKQERDCGLLKQRTKILETNLSEWLMDGEVDYLRDWAFEYACQEAKMIGLPYTDINFTYLQVKRRNEIMFLTTENVKKVVGNRTDIASIEIRLPLYEDIEKILKKKKIV